jgi:transcriptional regulator with XRE-family HTH domain
MPKKTVTTTSLPFRPKKLVALGKVIRKLRIRHGLTRTNVAALAWVNRDYIKRVERGEEDIPIRTVFKIAFALRIPASKLLKKARI